MISVNSDGDLDTSIPSLETMSGSSDEVFVECLQLSAITDSTDSTESGSTEVFSLVTLCS